MNKIITNKIQLSKVTTNIIRLGGVVATGVKHDGHYILFDGCHYVTHDGMYYKVK